VKEWVIRIAYVCDTIVVVLAGVEFVLVQWSCYDLLFYISVSFSSWSVPHIVHFFFTRTRELPSDLSNADNLLQQSIRLMYVTAKISSRILP
jgi:hypothetical protein